MSNDDRPTVLVIGATGSIGRPLVQELQTQPGSLSIRVRAAVRTQEKAEVFQKERIETVVFDFEQPETLPATLDGVDRVFLLTSYTVAMLAQSKALIDAAKKAGVKHIVHLGAWANDDTTIAHLGWHQYIERYIEWTGMDYTHLRPNWFMQGLLRMSSESIKNKRGVIDNYINDARVSWIDANDIALVAATVLREPKDHIGKTYPLAVEALSINEVANVLTDVVGQPFHAVPRSPEELLPVLLSGGVDPEYGKCGVQVMQRTADRTLTEAADVFDNFESLTGKKPTMWRDFAAKHKELFQYEESLQLR